MRTWRVTEGKIYRIIECRICKYEIKPATGAVQDFQDTNTNDGSFQICGQALKTHIFKKIEHCILKDLERITNATNSTDERKDGNVNGGYRLENWQVNSHQMDDKNGRWLVGRRGGMRELSV
ncbi:hypothetical protein SK128_016061 [Halocaridina rubra]|uniref:Uncharacterized protein n=1 Tax=Halocaridina rubra TaxID=373956 RepID=A0AAN8WTD7_HALRR